jgi:hypothetical protein
MRLNGASDLIDNATYPATSDDFIDNYGTHVIELQQGEETLGEVLSRLGSETYESPADVYAAVFSAVSHEAIGRRFYSDRDAPTVGESGPQQVSF